jgi:hypothetical protein
LISDAMLIIYFWIATMLYKPQYAWITSLFIITNL